MVKTQTNFHSHPCPRCANLTSKMAIFAFLASNGCFFKLQTWKCTRMHACSTKIFDTETRVMNISTVLENLCGARMHFGWKMKKMNSHTMQTAAGWSTFSPWRNRFASLCIFFYTNAQLCVNCQDRGYFRIRKLKYKNKTQCPHCFSVAMRCLHGLLVLTSIVIW